MDEPPLEGCDVYEGWLVEAVSGAEVTDGFRFCNPLEALLKYFLIVGAATAPAMTTIQQHNTTTPITINKVLFFISHSPLANLTDCTTPNQQTI
jgi:hypothetical protein